MIEHALAEVRNAQDDIEVKESYFQDGISDRDRAIAAAHDAGASIAEISTACGLTAGQVQTVIEYHAHLPESQLD